MAGRKAHQVWVQQCEAVEAIKARFGLKAAFDYIVGEKLHNFADASPHNRDFARELPRFVSEVRRMFTPDEIETQLIDHERMQNEEITDFLLDDDDPLPENTSASLERAWQFNLIKELLRASSLGTS